MIRGQQYRATSIFSDEPAQEFLEWLEKRKSELTPEQWKTARMEVKAAVDFFMVGIVWDCLSTKEPDNGQKKNNPETRGEDSS